MVRRSRSVFTAVVFLVLTVQSIRVAWGYVSGPLDLVRVEGDLSEGERTVVTAAVYEAMSKGDVINARALRQEIADINWVRAVTVRRTWPNSVHVAVNREIPTVRWGFNEYLNGKGDILSMAENYSADLPSVNTAYTDSATSIQLFKTFSALVERSGLRIAELEESRAVGWTLTFANGLSVTMGKKNLLQRLRRFVHVYEEILQGNENHVVDADARYPNGVAIEWDVEISNLGASRGL